MKKTLLLSILLTVTIFLVLSPIIFRLINYLHPVVIAVVLLCMYLVILGGLLLVRQQSILINYRFFLVFILLYSLGLLLLLFFRPDNQSYQSINLIPFSTVGYYFSGEVYWLIAFYNLAANIGLFIPYGILLRLKEAGIIKMIVIPLFVISFIEVLQFLTRRGSMDIDDLILNVAGVLLGCILFPLFNKIIKIRMN